MSAALAGGMFIALSYLILTLIPLEYTGVSGVTHFTDGKPTAQRGNVMFPGLCS